MGNISHRVCRENENTHFTFSNVFPKNMPFMDNVEKIWWRRTGFRKHYGASASNAE
jgi:hypothetical protein